MGGGSSKAGSHWFVRAKVGQEDHVFRYSDYHDELVSAMDKIVRTIHDEVTKSAPNDDGSEFPVKVQLIFSLGYAGELSRLLNQRMTDTFLTLNGLPIVRPLEIDISIHMEQSSFVTQRRLGGIGEQLAQRARDMGIRATVRYVLNNGT